MHRLAPLLATLLACTEMPVRRDDRRPAAGPDQLAADLDSAAAAALTRTPAAGLAIAIARGDEVIFTGCYGYADVENRIPVGADTVFKIASITKQFTAAAVMKLVEAGKVALDADITTYVPEAPTQGYRVTIAQLLTHTSGIYSYTDDAAFTARAAISATPAELLAVAAAHPFHFPPGTDWSYSNTGFLLLALLVERTSGRTWDRFLAEELFARAGLHATRNGDDAGLIPGRAHGYATKDGVLIHAAFISMTTAWGSGSLCSTIRELLEWERALHHGRVVSADSYRQMTTPVTLADGTSYSYGFGLGVRDLDGHQLISHEGGIPGFQSWAGYFPDDDLIVVALVNTESKVASDVAQYAARRVLGLPPAPSDDRPVPASRLAALAGTYEITPSWVLTVRVAGNHLVASDYSGSHVLRYLGEDTFWFDQHPEERIRFVAEGAGVQRAVLDAIGMRVIARRRRRTHAPHPMRRGQTRLGTC